MGGHQKGFRKMRHERGGSDASKGALLSQVLLWETGIWSCWRNIGSPCRTCLRVIQPYRWGGWGLYTPALICPCCQNFHCSMAPAVQVAKCTPAGRGGPQAENWRRGSWKSGQGTPMCSGQGCVRRATDCFPLRYGASAWPAVPWPPFRGPLSPSSQVLCLLRAICGYCKTC